MIKAGQIAIVRFPYTDFAQGKVRPVLLLRKAPGPYDDWLTCMISTRLEKAIRDFDEIIASEDNDFVRSGLSQPSVARITRLALIAESKLMGKIGELDEERLERIHNRIALWITTGK